MTDVAVYLYLGWGIVSGDLSAGSFTALMNASFTLLGQMSKLTTTLPDLSETSLLISDAMRFNDYKPTLAVADRGLPAKQSVTALAFQGVGFSYDGQTAALENISLEVRRGETLALVGHNGAGKTTIIKLLLRLYDPTRGTITLNSVPYEQYDLAKFRSMFAVAFQDYQLYAYTIAENVLMRRCESEGDEKLVYDALGKVGLAEKVRGLDEGIHTPVTKEFSTQGELFSGGEMQKLAIARALAKDAPVVILDEPSSALDPLSEREIADLISTLFTDKISIIVSHRLSTTMGASHIAVIDQGRVAERGTHSEFIAAQGTYARMREAQARGYCEPKERSRREAEGD